jgi:hypothetical protein
MITVEWPYGFVEQAKDEEEVIQKIREDSTEPINRIEEPQGARFEQWQEFGINGRGWYFAARTYRLTAPS